MRGYSQLGEDWGAGSSRATSSRELIFAPPRDLMFSGSFEMVFLGSIIQNTALFLERKGRMVDFRDIQSGPNSYMFLHI